MHLAYQTLVNIIWITEWLNDWTTQIQRFHSVYSIITCSWRRGGGFVTADERGWGMILFSKQRNHGNCKTYRIITVKTTEDQEFTGKVLEESHCMFAFLHVNDVFFFLFFFQFCNIYWPWLSFCPSFKSHANCVIFFFGGGEVKDP